MVAGTSKDIGGINYHADKLPQQFVKQPEEILDQFKPFIELGTKNGSSRLEMADNLEILLSHYQLDSTSSKRYLLLRKSRNIVQLIISFILIVMGFGMIFIKAPPYFELYTIYYFTWDDGVTVMDLISLLIVFSGTFLLITSLMRLGKYYL